MRKKDFFWLIFFCFGNLQAEDLCNICLGPSNTAVNLAARPFICNGESVITIAGFYWNFQQEGMEIAIDNSIRTPPVSPTISEISELNNLIEANYIAFPSAWDFGFKLGIGYNLPCDGWDIGILWTYFHDTASVRESINAEENHTLIPLCSAFAAAASGPLFVREIHAHLKLQLQLIDIAVGREFWTSSNVTIHPHVGLRFAAIKQKCNLHHSGGSWSPRTTPAQEAFNNQITIHNDFKGIGLISGLNSTWHLKGGFSLMGAFSTSLIYGRFKITQDEVNRTALPPLVKKPILQTKDHLRCTRNFLDFSLGIQWATFFGKQCSHLFIGELTWEQHLFFDQNQMWRVNRIGRNSQVLPNNTGENAFHRRQGDLSTQGWTLTLRFEF